ncbi:SDR family NAD(P)-dependent oxidoreductase [Nonomuraea fuscirosea]|uniref:SDR family NAD(P)-dependent oxidoreductase n=1 Tax=Nonomuraea fuscirosea TaxID=1291556 RepID=UPI0011B20B7E|nr:SDR family NAD(P)-dependent oxidoreductase [Nonomuraea fuscirosea]
MLLGKKTAITYGAAGAVGSAVAHAFAAEGAQVFPTGRTSALLDAAAEKIQASAGMADVTTAARLDEDAVEAHVSGVENAGWLDDSFNAVSPIPASPSRTVVPLMGGVAFAWAAAEELSRRAGRRSGPVVSASCAGTRRGGRKRRN